MMPCLTQPAPSNLKKGLLRLKDAQTGQIFHQLPAPYEGQHLWLFYWTDDTNNKREVWRIPVRCCYSKLIELAAITRRKPRKQPPSAANSADTAQDGALTPPTGQSEPETPSTEGIPSPQSQELDADHPPSGGTMRGNRRG